MWCRKRNNILTQEEDELSLDSSLKYWFAIYTRPNHEKQVKSSIASKNIETFLPTIKKKKRNLYETPLFPRYLFTRVIPKTPLYFSALDTPGVVKMIGNKFGPLPVKEEEINSLKILVEKAKDSILPFLPIKVGDLVEVISGPFRGACGRLIRVDDKHAQLVVSITILNRAVAVAISPEVVRLI